MSSARLNLPFLSPGQVQKEFFHNEALQIIDMMTQPVVQTAGEDEPPADPVNGEMHLVGLSPVGLWHGHPQSLAAFSEGGWRFVAPFEGMAVVQVGSGLPLRFQSGSWKRGQVHASAVHINGTQVVGSQQPSIPAPSGGAVTDVEARGTIAKVLAALRSHGLIAD